MDEFFVALKYEKQFKYQFLSVPTQSYLKI
jgi:hypothetical protein